MTVWGEFIAAFGVFFLTHSLPVRPVVRTRLVAWLGQTGFTISYSLLSLSALAWVIGAAGRAPYVVLWRWAAWQNIITLIVMLCVCILLALSIGRPNPFSFGGARNQAFDAAKPGIIRFTRHPMLLALGLWAFAHILPNGDVAHVLLFGLFGSFAVLGGKIIDRRKKRQMGAAWGDLLHRAKGANTSFGTENRGNLALRLLAGLIAFLALLALHPVLFGVGPLP
ncbi:hypothetical protein ROLI_002270 [Roseobacter fucihabitans]|uniref:NnrU domain-containing protein n=1 Tax=Roseobacter fucihabitans TaxID=1537242 RepID=A0ABZ2BM35_9RHOB|nr:NnrU family protein [Roseobacter litoralis]MBC6963478.1 NnrU protein [Roseobacter litoralis]